MVRFGGNVKPITEPTSEPASTYNASTMLSESTVKPPSSSAPTTTKPPMQTTPSVKAPPEVATSTPSSTASFLTTQTTPSTTQVVLNTTSKQPSTPTAVSTTSSAPSLTKASTQPTPTSTTLPINIPPPSSQPRLQPEIVEVNGQLVGGYLPGLQPALVSETLMPGGGSVGGVIVPKQPPVGVVSEPVLPPGALEKLNESPPSGTTGTVQIGNLTFSGVRVVNLSTSPTTPKETTPPTSGGSSGTTHETGTPPSISITGSHTSPQPPGGGTTTPKPNPPHEMPTPIEVSPNQSQPVKVVSETVHTPPSEGSKTTTSQSRPTLPPVVGLPSPEHNATLITPIERTSAPPHVTPPSEAKKAPTNVITHLWIGWRIEPEVEEFIRRFVETFEHGRHPRMGGAPPPGASPSPPGVLPLPGAPLVVLLPQGTEQKQKVTV